ncbi:MAG: hypothetical protein B7733_09765 [Myxococcales bacterium FL481]|nr:MAG: hypothetical protein B7733_09765 [Myxococcales bacterium FL481]
MRSFRPAGPFVFTHGLVLALSLACAHSPRRSQVPAAPNWIDGSLAAVAIDPEQQQLAALANDPSAAAQLARLDRLLDLFDAARFGDDPAPRRALWSALGDTPISRGPQGTQAALTALMEQAWRVEDQHDLSGDAAKFLADLIMLVSVDLHHPQDTEDLRIRADAYRDLAQHGHPRIADNARWRLFDHVYHVLDATSEARPARRREIVAHILYTSQSDIAAYLVPGPSGHRKDLPTASQLVGELDGQRRSLVQIERWRALVERRADHDRDLVETALAALPAPRTTHWAVPMVPTGSGRPDPLAPVVLAGPQHVIIEPRTPTERQVSYASEDLAELLRAQMTRDGRGRLLLAAAPDLPTENLSAVLDATDKAAASTLDLAVLEPAGSADGARRVTVLPVQLYRPDDSLAARPFTASRLHVHLDRASASLWADGRLVPAPAGLVARVDLARSAYPHERVLTLSLGNSVGVSDLVEHLVPLIGGTSPRFSAIAWIPQAPPPPDASQSAEDIIERRLATLSAAGSPRLDQPYPLREQDQATLTAFGEQVHQCSAELEDARAARRCIVEVEFANGVLQDVEVRARPAGRAARLAMQSCVFDVGATLRFRDHRDRFSVRIHLGDAP